MKIEEIKRVREIYQRCWEFALRELLGWAPARTRLWAHQRGLDQMELGWLRHNTAMWYIASLLVPDSLKVPGKLKGETLVQFEARLEHALNFGQIMAPHALPELPIGSPPAGWMEAHMAKRAMGIERGLWLDKTRPELYNWEAGKARIQAILAEYGETVPKDNEAAN